MDFDDKKVEVAIFHLNELFEKTKYEEILNDPSCEVFRDVFTYDRAGRPIVTI